MSKDASAAKILFAERLKTAMTAAGLDPRAAVLERGFNQHFYGKPMTLHGVARWLKGEVLPPYNKVAALAKWLDVSAETLYGAPAPHAVQEPRAKFGPEIGYQDRELFEAFLSLPPQDRRAIREIILKFVKANRA